MVNAEKFVDAKAYQLSNYADAVVNGVLPSSEIKIYYWDTIEEWSQIKHPSLYTSEYESTFWYLLHQITFWHPNEINNCPELKYEIDSCIDFLRGEGVFPDFVAGIRP